MGAWIAGFLHFCMRKHIFNQICSFKNSNTKKYSVRKIVFDENNEILRMYENEHPEKLLNKFIKKSPKHKYKI